MIVAYRAFDRQGRAVTGTTEASSAAEATESLRRQGLFVAEANARETESKRDAGGRPSGRVSLRSLVVVLRQLSVLISTGTPVVEALEALERESRVASWRPVLRDLRTRVEEGSSLSAAMSAHPRHFDAVARSLVAAGESSGRLDSLLRRLADVTKQQLHIRGAIVGALVYPAMLVLVAVKVLLGMLLFVLPRFAGLFETLDMPLPATTRALMAVSGAVRHDWPWILGGLAAGGTALTLWARSRSGRRARDIGLARAPQIGRLYRSLATARAARLLGVLLESRVPLLDALQLVQDSCRNSLYADLFARARDAVTAGEPMSSAFSSTTLVDPSVGEALRHAERGGRVPEVLSGLADFLDEENATVVRALTTILEPIILIALGLLVGFVAISMFMPLFDLTAMGGAA